MFQQQLRDFQVPVGRGGIERMAARCDAFLRQVGIGPAFQEQFHDFQMPRRRGVAERGSRARVVGHILRRAVRKRRILIKQFPDAGQVADVRGGAKVTERAAGAQ